MEVLSTLSTMKPQITTTASSSFVTTTQSSFESFINSIDYGTNPIVTTCSETNPNCVIDHSEQCVGDPAYCNLTEKLPLILMTSHTVRLLRVLWRSDTIPGHNNYKTQKLNTYRGKFRREFRNVLERGHCLTLKHHQRHNHWQSQYRSRYANDDQEHSFIHSTTHMIHVTPSLKRNYGCTQTCQTSFAANGATVLGRDVVRSSFQDSLKTIPSVDAKVN
ncbi:hypothetical protein PVAND_013311 [Polypedilum vanderplanki]|uniref:Uncharacterized protein n=1 Tax=Polypedilum vanderplanki TaxID=319348 RepID=A0A9J6CR15_POLVA|nr:hypothetical protein PVAND_013311 [Polypedilum vanderplanki]